MKRRIASAVVLAAMLLAGLPGAGRADVRALGPGCVSASDPSTAAVALLGDGARVRDVEHVGRHRSALATIPVVVGGARHRLLGVPGGWCDALAGFNSALAADPEPDPPVLVASEFVQVAAARFFDGVRVVYVQEPDGPLQPYRLQTHARTNGVVADWLVLVAGGRVVRASWSAVRFAVPPVEAVVEGPTALPGATMSYRASGGRLVAEDDPFDDPVPAGPMPIEGVGSSIVDMPDGFRILVTRGNAPYVYPDLRTGAQPVDMFKLAVDTTVDNYTEFLDWGLRRGWDGDGYVFVDGGLSAYCLACVFPGRIFNVHITSLIVPILEVLGHSYGDNHDEAFSLVMGHEIFHNFQVAHAGPAFGDLPDAFVEGLARFQETIHSYGWVSHQPESLVYSDGPNGCNGYLERPPEYGLRYHTYDACFFWMAFYAQFGLDGLAALLDESAVDGSDLMGVIERASGTSVQDVGSRFAQHVITGTGLEWGPAIGPGDELDWAEHLTLWEPAGIGSVMDAGGVTGTRITDDTQQEFRWREDAETSVIRRAADGSVTRLTSQQGDSVSGPGPDEDVWLVSANGATYNELVPAEEAIEVPIGPVPVSGTGGWSYKNAGSPLGNATVMHAADASSAEFSAATTVEEPTTIDSSFGWARASVVGELSVRPGAYLVRATVVINDGISTVRRDLPNASAYASHSAYLSVACSGCYGTDYVGLPVPGTYTLTARVGATAPGRMVISAGGSTSAEASGGQAHANVSGRVVSLEISRLT